MAMEIIERIRQWTKSKNYGLAKSLRTLGVDVTIQGLDGYDRETAKGMRLDVLCGLRKLSGKSWEEFGKYLDKEFLEGTERKK
jgi:hypothetical protein